MTMRANGTDLKTRRSKIMIVDDNVSNLAVGRNLLKSAYDVYLANSASQMFDILEKIRPDLILLDIEMPETNGYEAIVRLKADKRFADTPVVFLTAQNNVESEIKGFELGAVDYINKPFSPPLLMKRIELQLLLVRQRETIRSHADNLSVIVSEKIGEVICLQNAIVGVVADLVEFRDKFTGGHIARTTLYLKAIINGLAEAGRYADEISEWDMDYVLQSAQLHDVGKIAIPDAILNKPARLTAEEFDTMKTHVLAGVDAVNKMIDKTRSNAFLRHTLSIVGAHHEKWDGSGYPAGLKGKEIPLEARLMAVADVYDALVSYRPYKEKMTHEQAKRIIVEGSGTHFDPAIIEVFLRVENEFRHISSTDNPDVDFVQSMISYSKDMEIGVPEIDNQHKEFINRVNNVIKLQSRAVSDSEARDVLDFLLSYVKKHFADEEALQVASAYPKYEWHKSQHHILALEFATLEDDFAKNGHTQEFARRLRDSVCVWIIDHIKSTDAEFGKYYQLRNGSGERLLKLGA